MPIEEWPGPSGRNGWLFRLTILLWPEGACGDSQTGEPSPSRWGNAAEIPGCIVSCFLFLIKTQAWDRQPEPGYSGPLAYRHLFGVYTRK